MSGRGIRFQEVVAAALALACAGLLVLTVRHLAIGLSGIARDATGLRARYQGLLDAPSGLRDPGAMESAIDDLVRAKGASADVRDRERARRDLAQRELAATVGKAAQEGVSGSYPWDPGPEPDLWFSSWRLEWQAWNARRAACEMLNERYRLGKGALNQLGISVQAAERAVARIDAELVRLRGLKDQAAELLRDPARLREFEAAAKGSPLARLVLFIVHLPLAGYFLVLFLKFAFRLALMREWMGGKRLADAD